MTPQQFKFNRQLMGLTQKTLAHKLGLSDVLICKIEKGETTLTPQLRIDFGLLMEKEGRKNK